jgi:hypothetical protein
VKKFFSNGLNVILLIVVALYAFDLISVLAGFGILSMSVLFYIEDHLRTLVALSREKTNAGV